MIKGRRFKISAGWYFVLPTLIVLILTIGWPLAEGIRMSLFRGSPSRRVFVGYDQYIRVLGDAEYRIALVNTLKFTVLGVGAHLIVGLLLAWLLDKTKVIQPVLRVLASVPWFMPGAVVAVLWRLLLNTNFGIVNYLLMNSGLAHTELRWLSSPSLALVAVIMVYTWRNYPFVMVSLLAAMQGISRDQYEAASMDGASEWQRFFHITITSIKQTLVVVTVLDVIWSIKEFDLVHVLTGGGPLSFSHVLATLVYRASFQQLDFGYGSAIAVTVMVINFCFAAIYMRLINARRMNKYE